MSAAIFLDFDIDSSLQVLHRCDNPSCFSPTHLWVGTNQDNNRDKMNKGREAKGDTHGKSKLTEAAVRAIKRQLQLGEWPIRLAAQHGVSRDTIGNIARGRTWRHIDPGCRIVSVSEIKTRAILAILKEKKAPVTIQELMDEAVRRGVHVPLSTMYYHLFRMLRGPVPSVIRVKPGHYQYDEKPPRASGPP